MKVSKCIVIVKSQISKIVKYIVEHWESYSLINTSNFQDLNSYSLILNIKSSKINISKAF